MVIAAMYAVELRKTDPARMSTVSLCGGKGGAVRSPFFCKTIHARRYGKDAGYSGCSCEHRTFHRD